MADKDKKLRVILKLPNKSSSGSKTGIAGASASPGVTSHKVHASQVSKPSAQIVGSNTSNRVSTPPKKRKFKTLVEGDAKDDLGGVYGAPTTTPPVFKAPLPPLAKKPSHKKKEKPLNGEIGVPFSAEKRPGMSIGLGHGGTPAPDKKVLEGVLDKLKKKDTYGVFSEPVDASMVPDYYDVIKEPMDFGTMYKKISKGAYYSLSLFEKDIMLICSNAMRYNGPETIYYKQARSIQDAARKALDVVAGQSGASEAGSAKPALQKKPPFPTKKGWKNTAAVKTLLDPASSDYASGASLAAEGDDLPLPSKAGSFNSKKGVPSDRSGSVAGEEPGYGVQSGGMEPEADAQDEQGAQLRPATLKDGRRPLSTEEYHRSSYKPRNLPAHGRGPPLAGVGGELHHLVPTGYQSEMAYAKSLSRFSARLGPEGWKFAAQRLQRVVPLSVPFGQGWIGEHEAPPGTIFRKFPTDAKVPNSTQVNQNLTSTSLPNLPVVSSTSHSTLTSASFVPAPKISRPLMVNPVAPTTMDSLLTTVTSAMLASGAATQALLPGKSTTDSASEKLPQAVYQLEHGSSRGQGVPSTSDGLSVATGRSVWSSEAPAIPPTSAMIMQTASDSANGALSRWTGPTSQAAPTFVYSTAVRTVPISASMSIVQEEAGKAQAHNLGLLQADAMARAKIQSNVHLSQAPRPVQYVQQPLYTSVPSSFGMQPRATYRTNPLLSSQPIPNSKHDARPLKSASSQPLQLQMGPLVNYGLSQTRPLSNPTTLQQQTHSTKPPPDLNLQPMDSPSTPQTGSQLNPLGIPQSSLSLQL